MLRITKIETPPDLRLVIEGRVTHETAPELGRLSLDGPQAPALATLDLSGVTFADAPSVELLRRLRCKGVMLEGCSGFLSELLGPEGGAGAQADPLVEALRHGEADAFEALVRREGARMLATARRLLGNEEDAQDAVQEAFLQVHRNVDGFQGGSRISTWLHRIVVNAALMKLRSRRRKPEHELDELLPQFDEAGRWLRPVAGWERPSEELLESAETRAMVRRAIDELPPSYREVLMLRDIEELDTEETARMLGVSINAVKVRLHRARQALRTLLEGRLCEA
jgi:RNA polymerase sigma-70 factor (ECF subfamily)